MNKKNLRIITYIIASALSVIFLCACGSDRDVKDDKCISIMYPAYDEQTIIPESEEYYLYKALQKYKLENSEEDILENAINGREYYSMLTSYGAIKKGLSDVIIMPVELVEEWKASEIITDDCYMLPNNSVREQLNNKDILSYFIYKYGGQQWIEDFKNKKNPSTFCDEVFIKALNDTKSAVNSSDCPLDIRVRTNSIAMVINANLADNPEKLEAVREFCKAISNVELDKKVTDTKLTDESDETEVYNYSMHFSSGFLSETDEILDSYLSGNEYSAEEIANYYQDAYEKYPLIH